LLASNKISDSGRWCILTYNTHNHTSTSMGIKHNEPFT
jgi:hypothetical protein